VINVVDEKNYYHLKYALGSDKLYEYINNSLNVIDIRHRRKTIVGRIAR
jgi:hypothetical protein